MRAFGADDGKAKAHACGVDNTACPLPFPTYKPSAWMIVLRSRSCSQSRSQRGSLQPTPTGLLSPSAQVGIGDEVVPLHPILVHGTVREMRERRHTGLVFFKRPESVQIKTHMGSYRVQSLGNSSVDHPLLPRIFLPEKR